MFVSLGDILAAKMPRPQRLGSRYTMAIATLYESKCDWLALSLAIVMTTRDGPQTRKTKSHS
jgi:hypothetical protein